MFQTLSLNKLISTQKATDETSSELKANLFSEVIDAQAVSEIERGKYDLEMKSSLNAITIYTLLITSKPYALLIHCGSYVQSLKQLSNLRLLDLLYLDLSKGIDSTSSHMDSLQTIKLTRLLNISKLVISGEMCPRLHRMHNLKEIELKQLGRLNSIEVYRCGKLECPKLQSVEGFG